MAPTSLSDRQREQGSDKEGKIGLRERVTMSHARVKEGPFRTHDLAYPNGRNLQRHQHHMWHSTEFYKSQGCPLGEVTLPPLLGLSCQHLHPATHHWATMIKNIPAAIQASWRLCVSHAYVGTVEPTECPFRVGDFVLRRCLVAASNDGRIPILSPSSCMLGIKEFAHV
ncbi:hypothetical protein H257_12763 [Aphanomyces astaci]|uniref:Uncharacterized protein n=1 Tax=Aphanomyces astaci TaxID=112090 RepID=W4FWR4_APHAT|nr:hypothetical protein H257_12763 [Aphanomyces astaci]ETV71932.1 hypothetical protein H257_12763 [Aphanomyces astaci]|eukprot:XP_009838375.1 hypothetical protein H257_12763 [Aphanomyces astaci]